MQDDASSGHGPLCVGLAHWRGHVIADTDEGQRLINREFSQWKMPLRDGPISTLHIDLLHNPLPRLRLMREGQQVDLSSFLTGPGGKRFVPAQAGQRLLYSDLALGENTPVLELCGSELHILRPDLWLFLCLASAHLADADRILHRGSARRRLRRGRRRPGHHRAERQRQKHALLGARPGRCRLFQR